jgi:pilus assembly protein CpaB
VDRRKILLVVAVVVAALGAGLVFVYAQGAEDRAKDDIATVPVLVAQQMILPGESASDAANAGKLVSQEVPPAEALEGSTNEGADFKDSIALTTIYPGEQLLTQKFGTIEDIEGRPTLPIPDGLGATTVELTAQDKVGSFAQPGSHVAFYVTDRGGAASGGSGGTPAACLVEDDLLVLGVGSTSVNAPAPAPGGDVAVGSDNAQGEVVGTTLMTMAVDSDQAATLIYLRNFPDRFVLTFVLRNDESDLKPAKSCRSFNDALKNNLSSAGSNG